MSSLLKRISNRIVNRAEEEHGESYDLQYVIYKGLKSVKNDIIKYRWQSGIRFKLCYLNTKNNTAIYIPEDIDIIPFLDSVQYPQKFPEYYMSLLNSYNHPDNIVIKYPSDDEIKFIIDPIIEHFMKHGYSGSKYGEINIFMEPDNDCHINVHSLYTVVSDNTANQPVGKTFTMPILVETYLSESDTTEEVEEDGDSE